MIVADASLLIAHLDRTDAHHRRATALLASLGPAPLAASPLTLAEVLVGPAGAGRLELARSALADLGVADVGLGADAPARLAELRARSGLKLPDCCVLLAAQDVGGDVATFDTRLAGAAREVGLAVRDRA